MSETYITMKQMGGMFGRTSHQVGKRLKELGFRTEEGKPSQMAFQDKLVDRKVTTEDGHYLWAWHREKTVLLLENNGWHKVDAMAGINNQ